MITPRQKVVMSLITKQMTENAQNIKVLIFLIKAVKGEMTWGVRRHHEKKKHSSRLGWRETESDWPT